MSKRGLIVVAMLALAVAAWADPIVISAADLKDEYKTDRREANSRYRRQQMIVFGYFDHLSDKLAHFKSGTYCSFSEGSLPALRSLGEGSYVVMVGIGSGHVFGDPSVRNCRIISQEEAGYIPEREGPSLWDSAIDTTAKVLFAMYDENEVRANRTFEDQRVIVTGPVSDFHETVFGAIVVSLDVGQWLSTVDCEMASGEEDRVIEMRKGQEVRLGGIGAGQVLGSPRLESCRVLN